MYIYIYIYVYLIEVLVGVVCWQSWSRCAQLEIVIMIWHQISGLGTGLWFFQASQKKQTTKARVALDPVVLEGKGEPVTKPSQQLRDT